MSIRKTSSVFAALSAVSLFVCACNESQNGEESSRRPSADSSGRNPASTGLPSDAADSLARQVNLLIDTSEKQLFVIKGGDTVKKYAISVGRSKYPTPVGQFSIHQIDFNPDWTPPEGDWAKNKKYEKPGSKNNPMGRARIVYQMPYTIHGTRDLNSLGEAESHGSVRMANNDVIDLAKLLMKESGTEKPESWYQQVLSDSTQMETVKLSKEIPLTNRE